MRVYLDNHATTPVDPRVVEAMMPFFTSDFGNASSITHAWGIKAKKVVQNSRELVASFINATSPEEIIFLSGATEANNLALIGAARYYKKSTGRDEIIISNIEHSSVHDTAKFLASEGFKVRMVKVDKDGIVNPDDVAQLISAKTLLVSIMYVNNEIGVIQDIDRIGRICREKDVIFHTDCAQAIGRLPIDVEKSCIDMLTATSHKIYGPKGIGFLYLRQFNPRRRVEPLIYGGGQENGLRSGTLNVMGIVGLAKACELAKDEMHGETQRIARLRDKLQHGLTSNLDNVYVNGSQEKRIANNLNVSFEFIEGEALITYLNEHGIAVTAGSACSSMKRNPSRVLSALGLREDLMHSAIRFGIGRFNTEQEIDYTISALTDCVKKLRDLSPLYEEAKKIGKRQIPRWNHQ